MELKQGRYDAIVIAVAHDQFKNVYTGTCFVGQRKHVLYDLKYVLDKEQSDIRL